MKPQQILAVLKTFPLALGLVGAAVLMAAWTYFRQDTLDADRLNAQDLAQQVETMSDNLTYGKDLAESLTALQIEVKGLEAGLIDPDHVIENQEYFYSFEESSGVHILDPTQAGTVRGKDPKGMSTTTFTLSATGSWSQIVSFLYQLETGPRLLRVSKFQLGKSGESSSDSVNQLEADLQVEVLGL
jgi:hypothetical protein